MVQALVAQDNDDEENPDMVCNIIMISKLVKYFNGYYLLLFFFLRVLFLYYVNCNSQFCLKVERHRSRTIDGI